MAVHIDENFLLVLFPALGSAADGEIECVLELAPSAEEATAVHGVYRHRLSVAGDLVYWGGSLQIQRGVFRNTERHLVGSFSAAVDHLQLVDAVATALVKLGVEVDYLATGGGGDSTTERPPTAGRFGWSEVACGVPAGPDNVDRAAGGS